MPTTANTDDGKIAITMELSAAVLDAFMATGDGWEARIDAALKDWLKHHNPSDVKI
ncbi:BrnA antitoxin family protein [Enterobacter hormaechei]|uniref:BrnA antitoxin family protein n=1 Tax=Enterobacter hormaechei TaxID=158836 RepID=UPI002A7605A6|nr:BrnA antitoxin family protein [Enterobacter hormaechei]MDY3570246.1 BrnA antitoxin family protein [Enterobacter hormaechei]